MEECLARRCLSDYSQRVAEGCYTERHMLAKDVSRALSRLTQRQSRVLRMRFGISGECNWVAPGYTLEEVAKDIGVSRERIRQIEAKALRRLRHPAAKRALALWAPWAGYVPTCAYWEHELKHELAVEQGPSDPWRDKMVAMMFEGQFGKDLMIKQGYVPATCTLDPKIAGPLIMSEIRRGRSPCWGCNSDRTVCKGAPKRKGDQDADKR